MSSLISPRNAASFAPSTDFPLLASAINFLFALTCYMPVPISISFFVLLILSPLSLFPLCPPRVLGPVRRPVELAKSLELNSFSDGNAASANFCLLQAASPSTSTRILFLGELLVIVGKELVLEMLLLDNSEPWIW